MSWSAKWSWKEETPGRVPAGARISAGKLGKVDRSLPNDAVSAVNLSPLSCIPSPESPAKRITTRSSCLTSMVTVLFISKSKLGSAGHSPLVRRWAARRSPRQGDNPNISSPLEHKHAEPPAVHCLGQGVSRPLTSCRGEPSSITVRSRSLAIRKQNRQGVVIQLRPRRVGFSHGKSRPSSRRGAAGLRDGVIRRSGGSGGQRAESWQYGECRGAEVRDCAGVDSEDLQHSYDGRDQRRDHGRRDADAGGED